MLLLIFFPLLRFNTSHVVVYPICTDKSRQCRQFQYISCCSLSQKHPTHESVSHFNTSHVVVYRTISNYLQKLVMFQYISCCSLSSVPTIRMFSHILFQYISCCSLSSLNLSPQSIIRVSIHLML